MGDARALGVRLYKPSADDWPAVNWAVVKGSPDELLHHGSIPLPRSYDEATALRHLHEMIVAAVKENNVTITFVWQIEGNAKMNNTMRPRLRAEGVVCAAASLAGSAVTLVVWKQIESLSGAKRAKTDYSKATEVCGIPVENADAQAVLVAIAALRG